MSDTDDAWTRGFVAALAEVHKLLLGGCESSGILSIAADAGITVSLAARAGVAEQDLHELRRAGVP